MPAADLTASPPRWELAAQMIVVKIRWLGLVLGYLLVNVPPGGQQQVVLNAILALGAGYALLDTYFSLRGRVFLESYPLSISAMEALFIGLLCYFHDGVDSPFRFYYFLSILCCALRYLPHVTFTTCAFHGISYILLFLAWGQDSQQVRQLILTLVVLAWVTWASNSMSLLLKSVGDYLGRLNLALRENQAQLEARIAERSRELQEAQAHVLHQEKMAAFGLLAAGIAHEVGNPLTSISSLIQMLQRRESDSYTQEKLNLVSGQLNRIQTTLRELINFSRPASLERTRLSLAGIIEEALNIAKYYQRTKGRILLPCVPPDLPPVEGVRDQLVQAILNLVLNAIDATERGGRIEINVARYAREIEVAVRDNGRGIAPEDAPRLFQPYFTTKKHGTGLGLFMTRKLVTDHGGSLEYVSRPGAGTEFRVRLPVGSSTN
jgi:signal transduction histidine kinase